MASQHSLTATAKATTSSLSVQRSGRRYWVAVASRAHVRLAVAGGFAQACHGRAQPLRRMRSGDWLAYYSPRHDMKGRGPMNPPERAFTAAGEVAAGATVVQVVSPTATTAKDAFRPFRVAVRYARRAAEVPAAPLLEKMSGPGGGQGATGVEKDETTGARGRRWGMAFRRGHFEVSERDFAIIAAAMGIELPPSSRTATTAVSSASTGDVAAETVVGGAHAAGIQQQEFSSSEK
ncbi:hypothetical protein HK405_004513 [Cladochytrium tenue]|nr:hypothetical protein HK405_004513 [Cladochytrium tenue]